MSTLERLAPIFRDVFDDESITPHSEMTAKEVAEWDSLGHIRLMVAIELAFGIKFSTSEISNLANVGELVSVIEKKL